MLLLFTFSPTITHFMLISALKFKICFIYSSLKNKQKKAPTNISRAMCFSLCPFLLILFDGGFNAQNFTILKVDPLFC